MLFEAKDRMGKGSGKREFLPTGRQGNEGDYKMIKRWAGKPARRLAGLGVFRSLSLREVARRSNHIINNEGELRRNSVVAKIATVQKEGKRSVVRSIEYYNLDAVISVGYRVNSKIATEFRRWATKTLREHITRGYTLNRKRIAGNYNAFMKAVADIQTLLPERRFCLCLVSP